MVGKLLTTSSLFLYSFLSLNVALADNITDTNCPDGGKYTDGLLKGLPCNKVPGAGNDVDALTYFKVIMQNIAGTILAILGALFVIMIIVGGIQYITASGNEERAKAGKKTITAAVIGLLITILSYAIVKIFATLIGGGVS